MKKVLLLLLLLLVPLVYADLPQCENTLEIETNCKLITPVVPSCTSYNYTAYTTDTGQVSEAANLTLLNTSQPDSGIYYFNFTLPAGGYIIKLCNDASREVVVKEDITMEVLIIFLVFIIGATLAVFGRYLKNAFFVGFAGIWFIISAFYRLFNNTIFGWETVTFFFLMGVMFLYQYVRIRTMDKKKAKQDSYEDDN